ncbi:vomeronasal type-2 receptor 116-like [Dipodomys merriami]|uniref:vomeronasal type-2 receptor 116-like n=1 Tax=Dipodomys merriami TaxID=94247 RepID=UPI00385566E0
MGVALLMLKGLCCSGVGSPSARGARWRLVQPGVVGCGGCAGLQQRRCEVASWLAAGSLVGGCLQLLGASAEMPVAAWWCLGCKSLGLQQPPSAPVSSEQITDRTLFIFKNYQFLLALAFAIEEINKNPDLLHNLTLGFDVYDVQFGTWRIFKTPFIWLFGKYKIPNYSCMRDSKSIAVLTGSFGITSACIGTLLQLYRFPQFTLGPFDHALSDHHKFPALYQMAPKDTSIATAMVSLLLHFSWNWVGLFTSQDENGLWILPELKEEMAKNSVCVAYELLIPSNGIAHINRIMAGYNEINKSSANVLIIYGDNESLLDLMLFIEHILMKGKLHPFLKNIQFYNPAGDQVILDEKRKLEPEYDILNIWDFPEGLQFEVKVGKFSPYALHGNQLSLSEDMIEWAIETAETPHSVCSESCGLGFRKSPQEGKPACCFDCNPCQQNEIAHGTDMEQCVKCTDHQYANTQRNKCLRRDESFLAFGDPLGMALACMGICFSVLTAAILGMFLKHQDTAIVKANNRTLSYILLISLIFCFLCSLLFIGRPNTVTCILRQITFGLVFTVAVSTVLAKTVTVVLAFKVISPGRRIRWLLVSGAPNLIIPLCTLIQMTFCGFWLGISPPFVDTDAHSEHGHIIILCNKGSLTAFYCVLGYLGSLAMASFTVAFLARNLPDTFNEAKFLTFSMLVFCTVWLTFLPVYHSAKGKIMVALEVFSILASSAGLLGCIFVPKCYNILLMPNKNSLHVFSCGSGSNSGCNRYTCNTESLGQRQKMWRASGFYSTPARTDKEQTSSPCRLQTREDLGNNTPAASVEA